MHKIWASSLVVTATVKGGVSSSTFKKVQNSFPKEAIPDDILKVIKLCKKISPSSKSEYIFPITPDLLGESFFLLFINRMDDIKWMRASLEGLLFHELSENDDDYVEFFEFLIRLIRNMMNDNHDSQFFNKSRGNLAEFLRSISLKGNKKYKFAASMALMNLICMSNDEGFISSYNYFLHPPYFNKYDCYFFTPQQFIVFIIDTLDSYSKKNKHDYNHFDYPELITNCVLNSAPVNAYNKYKKSSRYQYLKFNIPSRVINKTFGDQIFYNDELWLRAVSSLDGADNILDSIIKYQKDTKSDYLQNAGLSPLICAIISGNPEAVDFLLQYMNRYELEGNIGSAQYTPLLLACELGDIEIVKSLVNKGANYNIRDSDGYSPLMLSLLHEHENITLYLLEHEIEIDEPNNKSFTELMLSCRVGNVIAAEMLLAKSADIDKTNDRKDTPIMIASYSGHYDIVELLIKNGARLKEVNSDGDSACELALNNNFTDIASLITLHSESEV
ncbi:ankyrin repeat domain-containing protein [Oceanobacter antarcticus]|uniref:Ankyrin repeat domain-containing protein n=1 Tax=Oceanobacter antarcticus TaxID=3133425 RepID=A0ABW8NIF7_9GAMM